MLKFYSAKKEAATIYLAFSSPRVYFERERTRQALTMTLSIIIIIINVPETEKLMNGRNGCDRPLVINLNANIDREFMGIHAAILKKTRSEEGRDELSNDEEKMGP